MRVKIFLVSTVVFGREVGCGGTPLARIDGRLVGSNVGRSKGICSLPEPNLNARLPAACEGIESTSAGVETLTVRRRRGNSSSTALVMVELGVTVRRDG